MPAKIHLSIDQFELIVAEMLAAKPADPRDQVLVADADLEPDEMGLATRASQLLSLLASTSVRNLAVSKERPASRWFRRISQFSTTGSDTSRSAA